MKNTIYLLQIVLAILVSILVFLQSKGSGLSKSVGTSSYHSRRGLEKIMFKITIFLVVFFVVLSIWSQFIP